MGVHLSVTTLNLVLPVGISFYTFQALSYTIDVYKGKVEATKDVVAFMAFISFFPQLVAGPIERATNLLPQFLKGRKFDYAQAVDGTKQVLWGLFKKMVIADNCADFVDKIWNGYSNSNSVMLCLAAVLFAFQIYGDFSGYSDIAIGTARILGINLKRNFHYPYFSRNVAEFWKRWHISLNTWFVNYLYIPLGGNRRGKLIQFRNTLVIFLTCGLWHGANWTFIVWGLYHALLFLPLMLFGNSKKLRDAEETRMLPTLKELAIMLITFSLVVFGWIIFRSNNIGEFFDYVYHIASNWSVGKISRLPVMTIFFILMMLLVEWFNRQKEYGLQFSLPKRWMRWFLYVILALVILTCAGKQAQFIYFQF